MIIVMNSHATELEIKNVEDKLVELGFKTHPIYGEEKTVIGAIGDKRDAYMGLFEIMQGVECVIPILKPYKLVGRQLKPEKSVFNIGDLTIGGEQLMVMAGPCAVESAEQLYEAAEIIKAAGANVLRGGAFKPRTSPYAFQGLQEEGLKLLAEARKRTGLAIVTEVIDTRDVDLIALYADFIQIGARNMQNFALLKEVGMTRKPVVLKRGLSSTIEEWLMAAEYIISGGNEQVILCERGIRSFDNATRNIVDISAIPVVRELSHLPIIIDPSHGTGKWQYVSPMAKAAVAAGADGVMIEVHPCPEKALCDGPQSLNPGNFQTLMGELKTIASACGRKI